MMSSRSSSSVLLAATCLLLISVPGSWTRDFSSVICEGSVAELKCDHGQVISVLAADYGRHDRTTCAAGKPLHEVQNVQCSNPVTTVVERCNGRGSCSVRASNSEFGDPCRGTYKYLSVDYSCETPEQDPRVIHSETCEGNVAQLSCDPPQFLAILRANYGRHDRTICAAGRPGSETFNVFCSNPANKVSERCDGKSSCSIRASNSEFGDPCVGTYKYLEVDYICHFHSVTCEGGTAVLNCGSRKVISVFNANYGRRDRTTCASGKPPSQIQDVNCLRMVADRVAQRCDGQNSCTIRATNSEFGDPCVGTYKYLEVDYICECE